MGMLMGMLMVFAGMLMYNCHSHRPSSQPTNRPADIQQPAGQAAAPRPPSSQTAQPTYSSRPAKQAVPPSTRPPSRQCIAEPLACSPTPSR